MAIKKLKLYNGELTLTVTSNSYMIHGENTKRDERYILAKVHADVPELKVPGKALADAIMAIETMYDALAQAHKATTDPVLKGVINFAMMKARGEL